MKKENTSEKFNKESSSNSDKKKSTMSPEEAARITAEIRAERKRNGQNAPF
jgi:hypothetical protein